MDHTMAVQVFGETSVDSWEKIKYFRLEEFEDTMEAGSDYPIK
jgi:hypothetical protein